MKTENINFKSYPIYIVISVIILSLFSGCSMKMGATISSSNYIFPNSNVTPLGQTYASYKKTSFLLPPGMNGGRVVKDLTESAKAKYPDADILIDYTIDTKFTSIMMFHTIKIELRGTAAKMEIGKQDIGQNK